MSRVDRFHRHISAAQLQRGRENWQALEEQYESEQRQAIWKAQEMANRQKSPMGIIRTNLSEADRAVSALGELNQKLDAALDEVERAFSREGLAAKANATTEADARRAPVLQNRPRFSGRQS